MVAYRDKDNLTEHIIVRVTKREKQLIEKQAKSEKLNVSEYVRFVITVDLLIFGPFEAAKDILRRMKYFFAKKAEDRATYIASEMGFQKRADSLNMPD